MKLIEMVCTGNNGRSPVAELIAQNYLSDIRAQGEYRAVSSGTAVEASRQGIMSAESMQSILELARTRALEIYNSEQLAELEAAISAGDGAVLKRYAMLVAEYFQSEELHFRAEALKKFGIKGQVKQTPEQTVVRPDAVVVLAMDKTNWRRVNDKIYASSERRPLIAVLAEFASRIPDDETPNAWGKDRSEYFRTVESLLVHVPMAVDRVIH